MNRDLIKEPEGQCFIVCVGTGDLHRERENVVPIRTIFFEGYQEARPLPKDYQQQLALFEEIRRL